MTKVKDKTLQAAKKGQITEVLEQVADGVSPEAEKELTRELPPMRPGFIAKQAEKFGTTVERVTEIAQTVAQTMPTPLVIEKREISVDSNVQEYFRELFQREIDKRKTCPFVQHGKHFNHRGQETSASSICGDKLETVQQAWVHQALHIMYDSGDPRTQRAMLMDIRELLWPTQEKSVRAALGPDERAEHRSALERHRARALARG